VRGVIAYLVLGHRAPKQVAALTGLLTSAGDIAVVHVDQRVDVAPFHEALERQPSTALARDRVAVRWAGWSMVEATLSLIRQALDDHPETQRLVLLSGDSFPLRPPEALRGFFADRPRTEFLNAVAMPSVALGKPLSRISNFHVEHDRDSRLGAAFEGLHRMAYRPGFRRALGGRRPMAGSQWWALTADAARLLLDTCEQEQRLMKLMRHSAVPDEHFFQTVLGNSALSDNLRPGLMMTTFSASSASPDTIGPADVKQLACGGLRVIDGYGVRDLLFARKFDPARPDIVEAVRQHIWPLGADCVEDVSPHGQAAVGDR
jgi:hypothetical protein